MTQCRRKVKFEWARVLHETLLVSVPMQDSEKMICKEERFRIRAVQMDNLRDKVVVWRVKKGVHEMIDEGVLWWFSPVERIENDRVVRGCMKGSRIVGRS